MSRSSIKMKKEGKWVVNFSKTESMNNVPFEISEFIKVIAESAQRSRQVLLVLVFSTALILMALVNSVKEGYNWYLSKMAIYNTMNNYFVFDNDSTALTSLSEFIQKNEQNNSTTATAEILNIYSSEDYVLNPFIRIKCPTQYGFINSNNRNQIYFEIARAIKYANSHDIHYKDEVSQYLNLLNEGMIEHIQFVKVPILGITFDVNYLGFYSGLLLIVLYFIIYYAFMREHTNTIIAFKYNISHSEYHDYYFYEFLSMQQVLFRPQRLFKNKSLKTKHINFVSVSIALPIIVYLAVVGHDWYSLDKGKLTNENMTYISLIVSTFFFIFLSIRWVFVWKLGKKMDRLWYNMALEYNFGFILSKLGIDTGDTNTNDLGKFENSQLTPDDKNLVMLKWYEHVAALNNLSIEETKKTIKMYELFVNNFLNPHFISDEREYFNQLKRDNASDIEKKKITLSWDKLLDWYKTSPEEKFYRNFEQSLHDVVRNIRTEITSNEIIP